MAANAENPENRTEQNLFARAQDRERLGLPPIP